MKEQSSTNAYVWTGRIPSHWTHMRLGSVFTERNANTTAEQTLPLSVTKSGIVEQQAHVAKSQDGAPKKRVERGDLVINSRSDRKGSAGLAHRAGSVSLINIVLQPVGIQPQFAHHLLRSTAFQEEFFRHGSGIVDDLWTTRYSAMKSIQLPIPPQEEQRAIADYLDHETAEIDAFIADLELAWHLTNSRFDGRLATTFAEVPDWVSLRRLATLSTGSTPSSSWGEDAFHPDGLDWIGPGDINESERITRGSKKLSQLVSSEVRVHRTPAILVVGIGATVGRVGQTEGPFATNQQITAVTPKSVDTKYLYFALRSLSTYIRKTAHGNTLPIVNNSQLGALKVPLVSSTDQVRLACELDIEMSRTKEVGNEIRQAVDLARERRTALISAVVTGQIDVTQRHRPIAKELKDEVLQKT